MTSGSAARHARTQDNPNGHGDATATRARRTRRRRWWGALGALVAVGAVTAALLSARPEQNTEISMAPLFTLPASDGTTVTLEQLRGDPVLLYFNEGAGCDACIAQMGAIEDEPGFADAGITVLPIVMNTADVINEQRERLDVEAPFLLDDGAVSSDYGTLGNGMHGYLPGHGFVLIDGEGQQLWQAEYPSMWVDPDELLEIVTDELERA